MSIPTITIVGNIAKDPQTGTSGTGKPWANFTIIAQSRRQDQSGNWVDGDKCPIRCVAFGRLARNTAATLRKGMGVIAQGRLRQTQYQAQDGSTRYSFDMTVDHIGPELTFETAAVTRNAKGGTPGPAQSAPAPPAGDAAGPWSNAGWQSGGFGGGDPDDPSI